MTFSLDLRWRGIVLIFVCDVELSVVSCLLGISERSLTRWYRRFIETGNVEKQNDRQKSSKWPLHLRADLVERFSGIKNVSDATIYRILRFDLGLTCKTLTKRAIDYLPRERAEFVQRLSPYYSGPDQLVFVDETSKDGRYVVWTGQRATRPPENASRSLEASASQFLP
ncbi:hypothetical protein PHMEG_00012869 [Phytophthora megakarya]|uniref:Uncharacterized protein n=1 Tax=Phytophthora megakarya TaxID=4795 RepID=A0A225W862_9STRA|nr:hypothetical protein PHMEG_00012869 [Phytophthora megakarya]